MNAIAEVGLEPVLDDLVKRYSRELFFSKARDWATESEVRYVLRTRTEGVEYVSIEGTLRAVCIGSEVPPVYEPAIRALCDEFSLELLKLIWENGKPIIVRRPELVIDSDAGAAQSWPRAAH